MTLCTPVLPQCHPDNANDGTAPAQQEAEPFGEEQVKKSGAFLVSNAPSMVGECVSYADHFSKEGL